MFYGLHNPPLISQGDNYNFLTAASMGLFLSITNEFWAVNLWHMGLGVPFLLQHLEFPLFRLPSITVAKEMVYNWWQQTSMAARYILPLYPRPTWHKFWT